MAAKQEHEERVTAPELEQFVVKNVHETGVDIGVGAYGSVEEVQIPGARVAAKKLHPQLVTFGSPEQVFKWISDFVAECRLMSQLRHPHIVQFLGVCYLSGSRLPVLLMEKLQTSLDNLLETTPDIPMDIKVYLLTGTSRGVVYLHSHTPPISHRDLTARNVLIDSGLTAKLADLGMARMVMIQPGQLAATMTRAPGNILYMPPEAVEEEGATRYNTAIDIFSFGVISLFTLTQSFPKNLKPATYRDPTTRKLVARSEIERREEYIQLMTAALGKTHPLVELTLNCLEYDHEDRPSATEVLKRLEEFGRTLPQDCSETKLEMSQRIARREEEFQRQLSERDAQIDQLQVDYDRLKAEKEEQARTLQRVQEEGVHRLQESRQRGVPVTVTPKKKAPPQTVIPSSITFNWRRCKNMQNNTKPYHSPVALNGKLYLSGEGSCIGMTVLEYTPVHDQWDELPPPRVFRFTIATFKDQLLVVGGKSNVTDKAVDTILTFDDSSRQWVQSRYRLPMKLSLPTVVGYHNHLIVAGGIDSCGSRIPNVIVFDTTTDKWLTVESVPTTDSYKSVLIDDTLILVCDGSKAVLRVHVPTLISQAKPGVWESLPNTTFYWSSPVTIASALLTVGGGIGDGSNNVTSIQLYDPDNKQWRNVGNLPEPMIHSYCTVLSGELFVLGGLFAKSVHVAKLTVGH